VAGNEILIGAVFVVIGVVLGVMGSGGSIVTLPVLTYVAGFAPEEAVTTTLFVVGTASAIGALLYYRQGYFHWKATLFLGLAGMPGAYFGAGLTGLVPPRAMMLLFAGVMTAAGLTMLKRQEKPARGTRSLIRLAALGLAIGLLAGFLGVGGGFLIVPALVVFAGIDARRAIAVSLGVISLNAIAGIAGHMASIHLPTVVFMVFLPLAVAGIWIGTTLARRLSETVLRKVFACAILVLALTIAAVSLGGAGL
jgi:uncharacterized membrane protein YfcA